MKFYLFDFNDSGDSAAVLVMAETPLQAILLAPKGMVLIKKIEFINGVAEL